MKLLKTLLPVLVASPAFAADPMNWQDVRVGDVVELSQALELGAIALPQGSRWNVEETYPLPTLPAIDVVLRRESCERPEEESEMALILPEGARARAEVGVLLGRECVLEIFVEKKDFGGLSFLRASE